VATLTRGPTRITGARLPILSWAPDLEPGALVQARNCADLPAAFHHVAVMADGHEGYGVPIGAVLALRDAVSPYAVGNDIGCGMALVATRLTRDDLLGPVATRSGSRGPVARDEIMGWVQSSIPAGLGSHRHAGADAAAEPLVEQTFAALEAASEACGIALSTSQSTRRGGGQRLTRAQLTARARDQLGTLGSGNHFIELLAGPDGDVWVLVHSGSRGLGGMVCANFHRMALDYCAAGGHRLADPGLAWLPMAGDDSWATVGHCYRAAMEAALEYAQLNRHRMLEAVAVIIERRFPGAMRWNETINIHHNDVAEESASGSTAKAPSRQWRTHRPSLPARWAPARCSGGASATQRRTARPPTVPGAPSAAVGPGGSCSSTSSSLPWRPPAARCSPPASPACSTRCPAPTRTWRRSWRTRPTWSSRYGASRRSPPTKAPTSRGDAGAAGHPPRNAERDQDDSEPLAMAEASVRLNETIERRGQPPFRAIVSLRDELRLWTGMTGASTPPMMPSWTRCWARSRREAGAFFEWRSGERHSRCPQRAVRSRGHLPGARRASASAARRAPPDELAAAAGKTVPDVIGPDLHVLLCGINPGLWAAAVRHHFAPPGNRFGRRHLPPGSPEWTRPGS
jgi:hypothetical protein